MANFPFDIALGREVEFHERVNNNDPANSALILMVLALVGLEADSVLRTYATFATLLAASNNEVTNANYGRKTMTDLDIVAATVNTTTHITTVTFANQTFTNIGAGDTWAKAILGYDSDTTGGGDASIVPICAWDLRDVNGNALVPATTTYVMSVPSGYLLSRSTT